MKGDKEMKATPAQIRAIDRYQNENIRKYVVKLNRKTEGDMIAYLEGKRAQTMFKMALKEYMEKH